MKKSTIILIVSLILIGLFVAEIQEVTGAWFWRFRRSYKPPTITPKYSCIDSDNGLNYNTRGIVTYTYTSWWSKRTITRTYTDRCYKNYLYEYYCLNNKLRTQRYTCPSGSRCENGACVKTCQDTTWTPDLSTVCSGDTLTQTSNCGNTREATGTKTCPSDQICQDSQCIIRECSDTDDGENYYFKGEINGYDTNDEYFTDFDYCELNGQETSSCDGEGCVLREYRCDYATSPGSKIVPIRGTYNCLDGCQDGACISSCPYACCSNDDCDDNNIYTKDDCYLQGTSRARCRFVYSYLRQNYFDYCWEYDCNALPPYPKLATPSIPDVAEVKYNLKGVGDVNTIVVLLYTDNPLPTEKLNILKADETDIRSFKYTSKWFKDNALKYNINLNLNIEFSSQQYKIPEEYIINSSQECWIKDKELFQYVMNDLPQYSNYDIIALFYYRSSPSDFSCSNHVMGTEGKKSFILFSKQSEPNNFYPSFDEGTAYSKTFAHESSHLLGATDKHTCLKPSSSNCQYAKQNGKGCIIESDNPNELGKDIMCHRVPEYHDIFGWSFLHPVLNELVIIEATAKEYGWFDFDGDGILEVNDPCPFIKNNIC